MKKDQPPPPDKPAPEPEFLKVSEVAERLRVSRPTLYRAIEIGRLKAIRVGRSVRVSAASLQAFIDAGASVAELWKFTPPAGREGAK